MIPGGASSRGSVPSEAVAAPSSGSESGRASVHDDALQDPRVCRYCGSVFNWINRKQTCQTCMNFMCRSCSARIQTTWGDAQICLRCARMTRASEPLCADGSAAGETQPPQWACIFGASRRGSSDQRRSNNKDAMLSSTGQTQAPRLLAPQKQSAIGARHVTKTSPATSTSEGFGRENKAAISTTASEEANATPPEANASTTTRAPMSGGKKVVPSELITNELCVDISASDPPVTAVELSTPSADKEGQSKPTSPPRQEPDQRNDHQESALPAVVVGAAATPTMTASGSSSSGRKQRNKSVLKYVADSLVKLAAPTTRCSVCHDHSAFEKGFVAGVCVGGVALAWGLVGIKVGLAIAHRRRPTT